MGGHLRSSSCCFILCEGDFVGRSFRLLCVCVCVCVCDYRIPPLPKQLEQLPQRSPRTTTHSRKKLPRRNQRSVVIAMCLPPPPHPQPHPLSWCALSCTIASSCGCIRAVGSGLQFPGTDIPSLCPHLAPHGSLPSYAAAHVQQVGSSQLILSLKWPLKSHHSPS